MNPSSDVSQYVCWPLGPGGTDEPAKGGGQCRGF